MHKPFRLTDRLRSFRFAFRGLLVMLRSQHNAWIHLLATAIVFAVAGFLGVSKLEWCCLVLAIVSVWTAEALNTAFEFLADVASPEFHPLVEQAKDVAAGAVLITAAGALVIGFLVLIPYFI
ncbi:MAG: diacylglycerol kinase family protein [Planctomyces sp.]|nr:diacylglycerol kinase family protein [Planctomyces sp.]